MAACCLLVSLASILVIDNDINAIHLARQRRIIKQAREPEAVESCNQLEESYNNYYKRLERDRSACNGDLEIGTESDAWHYRSVSCTNTEICYTTTYSASDPPQTSTADSSIYIKASPRFLDDHESSAENE